MLLIFMIVDVRGHELKPLLKQLDNLVDNKEYYVGVRKKKVDSLKIQFAGSENLREKIRLSNELSRQYIVFQTDSSMTYARKMLEYAIELGDKSRIALASVNIARVLDVIGQYQDALNVLDEVGYDIPEPEKSQLMYCRLTIYNSLIDYCVDKDAQKRYSGIASEYRDSVLRTDALPKNNYIFVRAEQMILDKRYNEAKKELLAVYSIRLLYQ